MGACVCEGGEFREDEMERKWSRWEGAKCWPTRARLSEGTQVPLSWTNPMVFKEIFGAMWLKSLGPIEVK